MEYYFDRAKHWPAATPQFLRLFGWIAGINIIGSSIYLWISWNADPVDSWSLYAASCFLFSGIMALWLRQRKMKPFITPGQAYLRINEGVLYNKLNRYSSEKRFSLNEVKYAEFNTTDILFHLKNGDDFFIQLESINNLDKRAEFEQFIKNKFPSV